MTSSSLPSQGLLCRRVHSDPCEVRPPMPACPALPPGQVHGEYDCTLNQTNIGNNNNKFYIIQLLEDGGRFACWNRWGRVVSARPLSPPPPPPSPASPPPPPPPPPPPLPAQHRPQLPRDPPHTQARGHRS